jgi:hypothetical protein
VLLFQERLLSMTRRALLIAAFAALSFSAAAIGGVRTTAPATSATVFVLISDQGIRVSAYSETLSANSPTLGMLRGAIPRGDVLHFEVLNRGKKLHDFVIFGKKTKVLKHGQRAKFRILATSRGKFPYMSTLDKGKTFRGFVSIY